MKYKLLAPKCHINRYRKGLASWYVASTTEYMYLRKDLSVRDSTGYDSGYWDTKEEAEEARQKYLEKENNMIQEPFVEGQKAFDYVTQKWGTVYKYIGPNYIGVAFDDTGAKSFTVDGKYYSTDAVPTLFHDEVKPIIPPKKPKKLSDLEVDTKVLVWVADSITPNKRYFSHFDKNGNIYCFNYGKTSFTASFEETSKWDSYEVIKSTVKSC